MSRQRRSTTTRRCSRSCDDSRRADALTCARRVECTALAPRMRRLSRMGNSNTCSMIHAHAIASCANPRTRWRTPVRRETVQVVGVDRSETFQQMLESERIAVAAAGPSGIAPVANLSQTLRAPRHATSIDPAQRRPKSMRFRLQSSCSRRRTFFDKPPAGSGAALACDACEERL